MKPSKTLIFTILLLLAVNTQFLWEGKVCVFLVVVYLLLLVCFIVLLVRLINFPREIHLCCHLRRR